MRSGLLDEPHLDMPLEVSSTITRRWSNTNYKLWHDTNSEFYHDYMHYFNRITGNDPARLLRSKVHRLSERPCVGRLDGHQVRRLRGQQVTARVGWPGLAPGGWVLIDVFPGMTYNLRTSVLRMDTAIPLGPEQGDDRVPWSRPEERYARAASRAHPRSQHDLGTVRSQSARGSARAYRARDSGDARRAPTVEWVIHGREENMTIHDEGGMRHFYAEWSRRMKRMACAPETSVAAA